MRMETDRKISGALAIKPSSRMIMGSGGGINCDESSDEWEEVQIGGDAAAGPPPSQSCSGAPAKTVKNEDTAIEKVNVKTNDSYNS